MLGQEECSTLKKKNRIEIHMGLQYKSHVCHNGVGTWFILLWYMVCDRVAKLTDSLKLTIIFRSSD